jgi:hypothetical protein
VFMCDHCAKPIERLEEGGVMWFEREGDRQEGCTVDAIYYVHRGPCFMAVEAKHEGEDVLLMDHGLDHHIVFMLNNSGWTKTVEKRARETAALLSSVEL